MKIFIATDVSVFVYQEKIYVPGKYSVILRRYYDAFGPIVLCSRSIALDEPPVRLNDISDIVDSVVEMGSLYQMFLHRCDRAMENAIKDCQLVIGRCPGIAAYRASDIARKLKLPFFAESMGCAWDAYWNHGMEGKLLAPYMFFKMKRVVRHADYALYVTSEFLQKRYPCKCESVAASNVLLSDIGEEILERRMERLATAHAREEITLMTTAALNVKYKGQQYVIRAIPKLNKMGIRVKYYLVGEGDSSFLHDEAVRLGVDDQVKIMGRLTLDEVFDLLDQSDIYIQPSLQEGLPRAMIEAMSRGCACIGAKTAGIPELIPSTCIVRRKSVCDIADAVKRLRDQDQLEILAKRNFNLSKLYRADVLNAKRNDYYKRIKDEIYANTYQ